MALSLPPGLKSKVTPNRVSDSDDNQPDEDEDDGGEFIAVHKQCTYRCFPNIQNVHQDLTAVKVTNCPSYCHKSSNNKVSYRYICCHPGGQKVM